jgi:predicted DsbA family dithiol-disulfide isomerase
MKDTENKNEDVQARLKALAEASGFHTNVPIFEDSYSTLAAHQLANSSTEQTKEKKRRKISDEDQRAIFRFLGYSSKERPPIS